MKRRSFIRHSAIAAAACFVSPSCSFDKGYAKTLGGEQKADPNSQLFGHGSHRYRLNKDWAKSNSLPIKDAHEMVQAKDGRLFLITNETKNNILIFNGDGKVIESWGNAFPGGHGLTLNEEGGEEFLYLTDHTLHQVYKTTLDGQVLMTIDAPLDAEGYKEISQFQPTETAIDSQGRIYVADGYGAQYISVFSPKGELIQVFGGPDSFENAHGICIDTRSTEPTLLISARAQNALKRYSMDGSLLNEIPLPGAMINRAVVKGDHVYLSVLKSGPAMRPESGFILIMDKNDKLVSCPFGSEPSVHTEDGVSLHQTIQLLKHPHDVCVDRNENLIVPQWNAGGVYPIMLERV